MGIENHTCLNGSKIIGSACEKDPCAFIYQFYSNHLASFQLQRILVYHLIFCSTTDTANITLDDVTWQNMLAIVNQKTESVLTTAFFIPYCNFSKPTRGKST